MKTVTEFSGSTLKQAAAVKTKLAGEGVAAEQMAERLGAEVNISGDRLARLMEALEAAGEQVERVRLMRVFAATDEPKGAKKIGEFNYLIDLQPSAVPAGRDRDKRGGGRGRGGPGGGGGGGRGAPGGAGGKSGPLGRDGLVREERGPVQSAGAGWTLTRDPSAPPADRKRGRPGGKPGGKGRPGDRRGPGGPGERRGPGGPPRPPGAPGAPGAEARDRFRGPRRDRPQGQRPPFPPGPRPPGQAAEAGGPTPPGAGGPPGPAGEHRRRRRRGRGGPFALQPTTAPGAAAALGIPTAATTGIDPNAQQAAGPPGAPGQKRRRRRGGRGRGQGPRPPLTGAPGEGAPPVEGAAAPSAPAPSAPAPSAPAPSAPAPFVPQHSAPSEANGNVRPSEPPPPVSADSSAPEPGNER